MKKTLLVACAALALVSCTTEQVDTRASLSELGAEPCADSWNDYQCLTIEVPYDHSDPTDERRLEVEFAVRPAERTREGVLVVAVGGPGGSGIWEKDWYDFSGNIFRHYDVVFFDQRGIGVYDYDICPETDKKLESKEFDGWWESWETTVDFYALLWPACLNEMGDPELLAYLGTEQAVADLEVFRQMMGYESITVLGQSYGTAYAQTYARLYPESVKSLVLDGPVDQTRDAVEEAFDVAQALEEILGRMFSQCDADEYCSADMGDPARAAYDQLIATLTDAPVAVDFPIEPDAYEERMLTAADVAELAFVAAYVDEWRTLFLRALATAHTDGDLIPMIRLGYLDGGSGIDDLVNWAVNCRDASIPGDTPEAEIAVLKDAYDGLAESHRWLTNFGLGCATWPHYPVLQETPGPFIGRGIPTLVVASIDDPTTPYSNAVRLLEHLEDGYLIRVDGGSHVMYGRGESCIDRTVVRFIRGTYSERERTCEVAPAYYPPKIATQGDRSWVLYTVEEELYYAPEAQAWDRYEDLIVGCSFGGSVTYRGDETTDSFEAEDCGIARLPDGRPWVLNATGVWDYEAGRTTITFAGDDGCREEYTMEWGGDPVVSTSCG